MNIKVIAALALVIIGVTAVSMSDCEDPEVKLVEATLYGIVEAVEAGDLETLETYVAADYSDRLGQDQRMAIRRAVQEVEHIPDVVVEFEGLDIDIDAPTRRATASFRPVLIGEVDPSLKRHPKLGFEDGKRLIVRMRKQDGLYLVTRADIGYAFGAALK
tara:strand:+ start:44 stop:523 length:480 start_codon:yes stop_codon:yes gene_type:complete